MKIFKSEEIIPNSSNLDNQCFIECKGVMKMIVKSIVVIDGEEIEIKDLPDREQFSERINKKVLLEINYIEEKTA